MKKFTGILISGCMLATPLCAWPTASKILTVDVQKVFDNYEKAKAAQAAYNESLSAADKELRTMYESIVKLNDEAKELQLKADNTALTDAARNKYRNEANAKLEEVRKKDIEFGQLRQDLSKQLNDRRQSEIAAQSKALEEAVAEIAKEKKVDIVLNKFTSALYVSDALDISDLVSARLNANGKSKAKAEQKNVSK